IWIAGWTSAVPPCGRARRWRRCLSGGGSWSLPRGKDPRAGWAFCVTVRQRSGTDRRAERRKQVSVVADGDIGSGGPSRGGAQLLARAPRDVRVDLRGPALRFGGDDGRARVAVLADGGVQRQRAQQFHPVLVGDALGAAGAEDVF